MNVMTPIIANILAVSLLLGVPAISAAQPEPEAGPAAIGSEAETRNAPSTPVSTMSQLGPDLDPAVADKLSAEQIVDILREREVTERERAGAPRVEAVAVPVAVFGFTALVIFVIVFFRFRGERVRHETLRAMVEKGAEIPPELLVPPVAAKKHADLRRGLVLLGAGLGLIGFLLVSGDPDMPRGVWGVGLIPTLIGAGYLLVWWLDKKGLANGNGDDRNQDRRTAL